MATIELNPIILSLHGRIGNVVFYHSRNKTYARIHVIPRNPDTEIQRIVRRTFANAVKSWRGMSQEEKY